MQASLQRTHPQPTSIPRRLKGSTLFSHRYFFSFFVLVPFFFSSVEQEQICQCCLSSDRQAGPSQLRNPIPSAPPMAARAVDLQCEPHQAAGTFAQVTRPRASRGEGNKNHRRKKSKNTKDDRLTRSPLSTRKLHLFNLR